MYIRTVRGPGVIERKYIISRTTNARLGPRPDHVRSVYLYATVSPMKMQVKPLPVHSALQETVIQGKQGEAAMN